MQLILGFVFGSSALVTLGIWLLRRSISPEKAANWPVTDGTIQSVSRVAVSRGSYSLDVGDFSYKVDGEYYSGRVTIGKSFSTGDRSPKNLINEKFQIRYDPRRPGKFSLAQTELGGFLLDPYNESSGTDVDPIDLNLNKI